MHVNEIASFTEIHLFNAAAKYIRMHGEATEKVPGGKLLRIKADYGERIERVQLTGDFFLYPEEEIASIEQALAGLPTDEDKKRIIALLDDTIAKKSIQLIGITPEAIAQTLRKAIDSG